MNHQLAQGWVPMRARSTEKKYIGDPKNGEGARPERTGNVSEIAIISAYNRCFFDLGWIIFKDQRLRAADGGVDRMRPDARIESHEKGSCRKGTG